MTYAEKVGVARRNRKLQTSTSTVTNAELLHDFRDVIGNLRQHCIAYEAGNEAMAMSIANVLRNLLHDGQGPALLNLVVNRRRLPFLSTAFQPPNAVNPKDFNPLCVLNGYIRIEADGSAPVSEVGYRPSYWVPYGRGFHLLSFDEYDVTWIQKRFSNWWHEPIVFDGDGHAFSRKEMVCYVANQAGGSHTNVDRDAHHLRLSRRESILKFSLRVGNSAAEPSRGPHHAVIRQISYELQRTLDLYCSDLLNEPATVPPNLVRLEAITSSMQVTLDSDYLRSVLADLERHGLTNKSTTEQARARLYWSTIKR